MYYEVSRKRPEGGKTHVETVAAELRRKPSGVGDQAIRKNDKLTSVFGGWHI